MEEKVDTDINKQLNLWDREFYTWFTIRADNNEDNVRIHNEFKDYCKIECANNYTLGLKDLLEYRKNDWKYEALYDMIQGLYDKVAALEQVNSKTNEQEEEEDGGVF